MENKEDYVKEIIDKTSEEMIEIQPFYFKITKKTLEYGGNNYMMRICNKMLALFDRYIRGRYETTWCYSSIPLKGYSLHPAFIRNNEKIDDLYIGAYKDG